MTFGVGVQTTLALHADKQLLSYPLTVIFFLLPRRHALVLQEPVMPHMKCSLTLMR
jgi:hypothetical protein